MSAHAEDIVLRELGPLVELKDAERFQRLVWGERDVPDNADLMLAIGHEGGLVAGAFEGEAMIGFLFAFPTSRPHVQHSHRLGVHPRRQGKGIGARLKWYQREWCLERGITLVRWTYDPLRRANATLNIDRLGATAGTYHEDRYGAMEGINAGIPSDRIVADWRLDAPEFVRRARGERRPADGAGTFDADRHVAIPTDLDELLSRDPDAARRERLRVREALRDAFSAGWRIVGFDRRTCRYRLSADGDG